MLSRFKLTAMALLFAVGSLYYLKAKLFESPLFLDRVFPEISSEEVLGVEVSSAGRSFAIARTSVDAPWQLESSAEGRVDLEVAQDLLTTAMGLRAENDFTAEKNLSTYGLETPWYKLSLKGSFGVKTVLVGAESELSARRYILREGESRVLLSDAEMIESIAEKAQGLQNLLPLSFEPKTVKRISLQAVGRELLVFEKDTVPNGPDSNWRLLRSDKEFPADTYLLQRQLESLASLKADRVLSGSKPEHRGGVALGKPKLELQLELQESNIYGENQLSGSFGDLVRIKLGNQEGSVREDSYSKSEPGSAIYQFSGKSYRSWMRPWEMYIEKHPFSSISNVEVSGISTQFGEKEVVAYPAFDKFADLRDALQQFEVLSYEEFKPEHSKQNGFENPSLAFTFEVGDSPASLVVGKALSSKDESQAATDAPRYVKVHMLTGDTFLAVVAAAEVKKLSDIVEEIS